MKGQKGTQEIEGQETTYTMQNAKNEDGHANTDKTKTKLKLNMIMQRQTQTKTKAYT